MQGASIDILVVHHENWLWEATCSIRGPLDAPKYKDYILPLLFYIRRALKSAIGRRTLEEVVVVRRFSLPDFGDLKCDAMFKLIVFAVVSVGFVLLSWSSLRDRRSHGFFRFFAFESILALILLNLEGWFSDPFSTLQVVSWLLLLSSLILAAHGFYLLGVIGRPEGRIENTTTLVTVGAYKYIRHPLYSSLLLLGWGVFFKDPSLLSSILVLATSAFLVATARVEEAENLQQFGTDYAVHMRTTKMFIPFLF